MKQFGNWQQLWIFYFYFTFVVFPLEIDGGAGVGPVAAGGGLEAAQISALVTTAAAEVNMRNDFKINTDVSKKLNYSVCTGVLAKKRK